MSCAAILAVIGSTNAEAQEDRHQRIDIAASNLPDAIAELSREAHVSIGTPGRLPHVRTPPVHGDMAVGDALDRLLAGTGYRARKVGPTAWRIEASASGKDRQPGGDPASGDAAAAGSLADIAPIVVTGAKRAQPLLDLPMAVSIVGMSDMQGFATSSDTASVASEMEGLALTGLGPGRNRLFLRGISDSAFSGESQSTVAIVLDEARLTYSAPDPDIRLIDVDRVEVLKGPQGSLYGIGALGGIFHIVTHRPDLDDTSLAASAGVETIAKGGTGVAGSAVGNLPIFPGTAALRLVGYTTKEPGWVDTGDRRDSNSSRVSGARAGLGIGAGGGWRIDLTGFSQWLESRDSRYVYEPRARIRPAQIAEPHDNDLRHLSARIAKTGGATDILLSSGITWHEVNDELDATIGAEQFDLADPRLLEDARYFRVWDSELRMNGRTGSLGWLFGLSHVEARQTALMTLTSQADAALTIDDDRRTSYDTAAFADLTLPLFDNISLAAGARLFRSVSREARLLPDGPVSRKRKRSGITPSLALSWQPNPDRLIFVRYGSAFRQGGTDIDSSGQLETLKGDELAMIEAGWRQEFGGHGRFDLGTWIAWWENLQSDLLEPDGIIETANAGDARILGVEGSLELSLSPSWQIEAGANYTSAMLTNNTLGFEIGDRHLPAVPEYTLRGAVRHDFKLGPCLAWVRMQLRYVGPSRLSFDPEIDRPMGKVLESRIEAHAKFDRWEAALSADNVFGTRADTFAFGNSLRFESMRQFTPQQPLTLSLSVLRKF